MRRGHFVKDWMTVNVISILPETTAREAIELMQKHKIRFLPVANGSELLGIVTERNLRNPLRTIHKPELAELYADEGNIRVKHFMAKDNLITITPQDHITAAANLVVQHKISGLPVIANNHSLHIVGVLTTTNLLQAFMDLVDDELLNGFCQTKKNAISHVLKMTYIFKQF